MHTRSTDYFLTIIRAGSINKAAAELFISQPALSQYVKRMEEYLGAQLLDRSKITSLKLTEAGQCFLEYCEALSQLWDDTVDDMQEIVLHQSRRYCVGFTRVYLEALLRQTDICSVITDNKIDVDTDLVGVLEDRLRRHELDMVVGALDFKHNDLQYVTIETHNMDLYVSKNHPLAQYSYQLPGNEHLRVPIHIAAPYPMLLLTEGNVTRTLCDNYFRYTNYHPLAIRTANRSLDVRLKLLTSNYVGFLTPQDQPTDALVPIALEPPICYSRGYIIRKGDSMPAPLMQLVKCCYDLEDLREKEQTL